MNIFMGSNYPTSQYKEIRPITNIRIVPIHYNDRTTYMIKAKYGIYKTWWFYLAPIFGWFAFIHNLVDSNIWHDVIECDTIEIAEKRRKMEMDYNNHLNKIKNGKRKIN